MVNEEDEFVLRIFRTQKSIHECFVLDLERLRELYSAWTEALPGVRPFYAVKCNSNPWFLSAIAELGLGFECASKSEMEKVLSLDVHPSRIIFAHPRKVPSHIKYASSCGIHTSTFDSISEISKVKACSGSNARLLLRLSVPQTASAIPLNRKFGASLSDVDVLLRSAHSAGVRVVGVAFHVGSGATLAKNYADAIALSRAVFDRAIALGLPPLHVLDIGGGFSTSSTLTLRHAARTIRNALAMHFPSGGIEIIAEPGRYFAESPFTLCTPIYAKRVTGHLLKEYWIADGTWGNLNKRDPSVTHPRPFRICSENVLHDSKYPSTVFGPTCDSDDHVLDGAMLPDLNEGDILVWPNMGAYTQVLGCSFNGYETTPTPVILATGKNKDEVDLIHKVKSKMAKMGYQTWES